MDTGVAITNVTTFEFEIIFTPGVDAKFYIDDVLKATITTNLPTGASFSSSVMTGLVTQANAAGDIQYLRIGKTKMMQER